MEKRIHLYLDDSGTRRPDHIPLPARTDGMNYFSLGGILIQEGADIDALMKDYKLFVTKWDIHYPLHSTKIRGRRSNFSWLRNDAEVEKNFISDLDAFLLSLPVLGICCAIHRPGYVERYSQKYNGQPWLMCKTAFAILIERSAKYARREGAKLEIFFEQSGKAEDTDIKNYMRDLKRNGMPFNKESSNHYNMLQASDFQEIVLGEPREKTKKAPLVQIADLFLYPIVKGGYDSSYLIYQKMIDAGKIIDATLSPKDIPTLGIKYSCFPDNK